jgi:F420-0:gamma-glutamyl ligase-like protein
MANLDDLLTATKNAVVALNTINTTINYFSGRLTTSTVTSTTLAITGSGILVNVSLTVTGSAVGTINDANTTGGVAASNALVSIPNTQVGTIACGQHFSKGLVIVPGSGQSINITYSLD